MPYDAARDQYFWLGKGYTSLPGQDGQNFLPNAPSPKLSDAFRVLSRHASIGTTLKGVIVGKLYKGKSAITGIPFVSDMASLSFVATSIGLSGQAVAKGGGGYSTEAKVAEWLGMKEVPDKIVGIYFELMD